jgi:AcrR family transcriptional regulator
MSPGAECAKPPAMSWSRHGRGGRRGYHHGNLREALIGAALDLISQKGPAGFTFAEAARQAGVSPAAPYRHFRDRDALMADVARQGFERFAQRLAAAWDDGRPSPTAALERLGRAYLGFARDEPAYFSAMFESGVPVARHRDLSEASDRAFTVLRQACEAVVATLPSGKRPPALMLALHIWALAHGIASLFARGDDARRSLPISAEELLEAATLLYLQGLGIAAPGANA